MIPFIFIYRWTGSDPFFSVATFSLFLSLCFAIVLSSHRSSVVGRIGPYALSGRNPASQPIPGFSSPESGCLFSANFIFILLAAVARPGSGCRTASGRSSPLSGKEAKLHRRDGLQCVRCHDALQVVLSDHRGLSPEAEHAMECASGHEPARGIFFSLNHSRIRTRTRGVQDNQDQDLGPWGLMVMPVTVIRRYSYTGEYNVYHTFIVSRARARTRNGIKYIQFICTLTGAGLRFTCRYTEVRLSLTMFSRRGSRRGETKVLSALSAACAKKTNILRTRAALTPAHNARE